MKNAFIISGVFISGLIGAGFASGSEILFYFSRYSFCGLSGILLSVLIFSSILYIVITRSRELLTYDMDSYFSHIMKKPLAVLSYIISYFFMLIIFSAMLSGSGELIHSVFGIKKMYGALIMLFSTHLILLKGYKGFLTVQSFLSVFIILSTIFLGIYILFFREQSLSVFKPNIDWGISGISYASYNLLTACAILCILSKNSDNNSAKKASLITFVTLLTILTILWYIICIYSGMIILGSMPLLTIAKRQSKILGYMYSATIFISMLTTAISNSYALIDRISKNTGKKLAHYGVICTGFLLSGMDFSFIVDRMYRFVGLLSIFVIIYIYIDFLKNVKKNDYVRKKAKIKDNRSKLNLF